LILIQNWARGSLLDFILRTATVAVFYRFFTNSCVAEKATLTIMRLLLCLEYEHKPFASCQIYSVRVPAF
jgi:hypothetical protein